MPYFNTTHIDAGALAERIRNAKRQEDKLLAVFRAYPDHNFTADELFAAGILPNGTPVTSYRRSLSNLKNDCLIFKTDIRRDGLYGKPTYAWQLTPPTTTQTTLF